MFEGRIQLRTETLPLKTTIQGISNELSDLQDNITRESADRSVKLQALHDQRAIVEEERAERNRERNRALLGLGYSTRAPPSPIFPPTTKLKKIRSVCKPPRRPSHHRSVSLPNP